MGGSKLNNFLIKTMNFKTTRILGKNCHPFTPYNIDRLNARTFINYLPVCKPSTSRVSASLEFDAQDEQYQPSLFGRLLAASMYAMPALDGSAITLSLFKWWSSLSWAWFVIEPLGTLYYSSSFTPLIIFIVILQGVCRNKKFKHVVRFHAMQSVVVGMAISLVSIIRTYLPPELRWSMFIILFDRFFGATILVTLFFCIWHAIQGKYADIPYISNSVYVHVELLDSLGG